MKVKPYISMELRKGTRVQGSELTDTDIGRCLENSFGRVLAIDVGKRVWLRSFGLTMENNKQRDHRKAMKRSYDKLVAEAEAIGECPGCGGYGDIAPCVCTTEDGSA